MSAHEGWRSLFHEGRHAFLGVLGRSIRGNAASSIASPSSVEASMPRWTAHERRRNCKARFARQVRGKPKSGFTKIGPGDDTVNQPDPGGFGRVELTPGEFRRSLFNAFSFSGFVCSWPVRSHTQECIMAPALPFYSEGSVAKQDLLPAPRSTIASAVRTMASSALRTAAFHCGDKSVASPRRFCRPRSVRT